jgi:integrase
MGVLYMSRKRNDRPTYLRHKASGQARILVYDGDGRRREILLGPYGTAASKIEYERICNQLAAGQPVQHAERKIPDLTVDELIVHFWEHAKQHYRHPDGRPTSEQAMLSRSFKELRRLYGDLPVNEFGPLCLKAVRADMLKNTICRNKQTPLARSTINAMVRRIQILFSWGVSEELVKPDIIVGLKTVSALRRGRTNARDMPAVGPVPDAHIVGILDHVSRTIRGMIQLQRFTAMRPSEVCQIRACDIDMSGRVWIYKPVAHKTAWHGKERIIPIGPKGQAIIREFMTMNTQDYLFSPQREYAERMADKRAQRKTPLWKSHQKSRRKVNPKWAPTPCYDKDSYARAVVRGIQAANKARREQAHREGRDLAEHELIPHWSPNRIRHTAATEIRRQFSIEHASTVLGHADVDTTAIYAERNLQLAKETALAMG